VQRAPELTRRKRARLLPRHRPSVLLGP
jgi:hypothetical protein